MSVKRGRAGITIRRIVVLVVVMMIASQAVLICIGFVYAKSVDRGMNVQQADIIADQVQRNMINRLSDVNNLLLVLQTQEFSNFFKQLMQLRDPETVEAKKREWLEKLQVLQISPQVVETIYFIGTNVNQASYLEDILSGAFEELPDLHTEQLDDAKLSKLFLQNHDRFVRLSQQQLRDSYHPDSRFIELQHRRAMEAFMADLQGRLILTNGNMNGVLIVLTLNERLFELALPRNKGNADYSVVNDQSQLLWTTASAEAAPFVSNWTASAQADSGAGAVIRTSRDLPAFYLHILISAEQAQRLPFRSGVWVKLLTVSVTTLAATFLISLLYSRKVFKPYRLISSKMKHKLQANGAELALQPIPNKLISRGFQTISMRSKIIALFCIAVSLPSALNGIWFASFLDKEVDYRAKQSVAMLGDFAVVGIAGQNRFLVNTANALSISQHLQDYLISNWPSSSAQLDREFRLSLNMYPGLNELSYFVLLDASGNCLYSSIYSNNRDIFNIAPKYLENRNAPYWVVNYEDIYNHVSIAILRKIEQTARSNPIAYLLLVPKESIFQVLESGQIKAGYVIQDGRERMVSSNHYLQDDSSSDLMHYQSNISGTDWHIEIQYWFNDIISKNKAYKQQFMLSILIVFLLGTGLAALIASVLTKPIKQLKETMLAAGNEGIARRLVYEGSNEIAGIIASYNYMIGQLEQTVRENMRMMEERAHSKVREKELLSMKAQAELNMLQAQINPHFLYNTLETIHMQSVKRGYHEIGTTVGALGDLLRYSISQGTATVPLDRELNHAANYVTIQQVRFGSSFQTTFDVADELRPFPVLRFILQPLLENAIKHGFEGWESGGEITISCMLEDGRLTIRVRDNGVGMDEATLEAIRSGMSGAPGEQAEASSDPYEEPHGIGLSNVVMRLKLFYKGRADVAVNSGLMRGTEIVLRIPNDTKAGEPPE